jgi:hypothetical protein
VRLQRRQETLFGDGTTVKYFAVVTNREDLAAPRLLEWHREEAGTTERVQDVLKKELGAGVLPCGRPRSLDFRRPLGYNYSLSRGGVGLGCPARSCAHGASQDSPCISRHTAPATFAGNFRGRAVPGRVFEEQA